MIYQIKIFINYFIHKFNKTSQDKYHLLQYNNSKGKEGKGNESPHEN